MPEVEYNADVAAAVNDALGADRFRCAYVDDAVSLVVAERDQYRDALKVISGNTPAAWKNSPHANERAIYETLDGAL